MNFIRWDIIAMKMQEIAELAIKNQEVIKKMESEKNNKQTITSDQPQGLTTEDLKIISLQTPLYHPFLGKGYPVKIEDHAVTVKFREGVQCKYETGGSVSDGHFIKYLFLKPIKITSAD